MRPIVSRLASLLVLNTALLSVPIQLTQAQTLPARSSANFKYKDLLQVLPCPTDRSAYGEFKDYGYWGGGTWCGQQGAAGHWVWVYPNWYVWSQKNTQTTIPPDLQKWATVGGKYSKLLQILHCPSDRSTYGEFKDYGYWGGGAWCGKQGVAGNWVWVYPNWYIWQR